MSEVKTIVYFDLEATGLKNSGKPRICELSFVAVNIQDVQQLASKMKGDKHFCEQSSLPRVINKLTLCVYPMAIIVPLVSDLTGLDNYNLSGQSNFNRTTVELINTFLTCIPSPVCLVAHNGNAYDFPLLNAECFYFEALQIQSEHFCLQIYRFLKCSTKENSQNSQKNTLSECSESTNPDPTEIGAISHNVDD